VVTYEGNLGMQAVDKSRNGQPLPTSDAYWCGKSDIDSINNLGTTDLDAVEVTGTDPPAIIEKIELVNPHQNADPVLAEGIRLQLKIRHPGTLRLGIHVSADADGGADAGADAGTQLVGVYQAMTIQ
jgi:hypothetical protein